MPQITIERLLESKIGVSVEAIGAKVIEKAVRHRMTVGGLTDLNAYLQQLQTSEYEWNELVEMVVIPETWFFRNRQSFTFLEEYIKTEWLPQHQGKVLRVLSAPCSTGEEPYSIAITLLEAGLRPEHAHIDAVDISANALQKAKLATYGAESFRNKETLALRERYFENKKKTYHLHANVKRLVRFLQGNLLDSKLLADEKPYQVIFCRNLLIYLGNDAKKRTVAVLSRLLTKTGILFVGHAERPMFEGLEFNWVRQPGVFACRRIHETQLRKQRRFLQIPYPFERRKTSQIVEQSQMNTVSPSLDKRQQGKEPKSTIPSFERRHPTETTTKLLDRARQLADQGKLNEAFALCEQSLRENPADVQANFLAGLIWLALGNDEQAETFFTKTVYLDPQHHEALNYLAFIAEYRGQHEKALLLRQRIERIHKKFQTAA
ncbi:CheR methyltransferase, SAM binding domain protein [Candidatus Vecturithrix granuli]|uniref:CheR methyltransferase, SAM binding domain protein n=1 Tax=Vecturithrix granuli TaxID=1499967 RepID=A0A081BXI2_VECG1|nr:CheR methyltransferase, SAM binding domain protein [Candidatus Vecturithrix granuli]